MRKSIRKNAEITPGKDPAKSARERASILPGENLATSAPFTGNKIAYFLGGVNPASVSKGVDENGEPMVVCHGSKNEIVRNVEDPNTRHPDHEGTRAIIGIRPDNTIVITGSEIDADDSPVAKQRAAELAPRPHVRSEEVIRAPKKRFSSDGDIVAQTAPETQGGDVVNRARGRLILI